MFGQSSGGGGGPSYGNANSRMTGGHGGYSFQSPHSQNKIDSVDINRQCTYKEYLRDCFIYKDFRDLSLA